jgi:alkyl hydroperoxide reductase subunit AhpC
VTKEKLLKKITPGYPILSDSSKNTIQDYGVLDKSDRDIALPATFIIDKQGIIRWFKIGESKWDRPDNDQLIRVLTEINGGK